MFINLDLRYRYICKHKCTIEKKRERKKKKRHQDQTSFFYKLYINSHYRNYATQCVTEMRAGWINGDYRRQAAAVIISNTLITASVMRSVDAPG